jgi:hypothetical protein
LDVATIKKLFRVLNAELAEKNIVGEIGICGGAVMCLVYQIRKATKDIDAIFEPTAAIRKASAAVAAKWGISKDWLNDAAKAYFHADPPREEVMALSHLRVWAPRADYMLAMKCISARFDSFDRDDVQFLTKYLKLKTPEQVFEIISKYYPREKVPPKTQFLIEEILG